MDSETSVWDEILRLARDCWELENSAALPGADD
jgi:hypothetical protein